MTGIMLTELLAMIEEQYGYTLVDHILLESELPSGGVYTPAGLYRDAEFTLLLEKLSQRTQRPTPDLLYSFGRYLFICFVRDRGGLIDSCNSAFSLLSSIEEMMHKEISKLYPHAEFPHFVVSQLTGHHLTLQYNSQRKLGDFAHGLIMGCLAHFGELATVVKTNQTEDGSQVLFDIVWPNQ